MNVRHYVATSDYVPRMDRREFVPKPGENRRDRWGSANFGNWNSGNSGLNRFSAFPRFRAWLPGLGFA